MQESLRELGHSLAGAAACQDPPLAIYLDTNVICRWRSFGELERLALSIAADQLRLPIVVPELVAVEATALYERELIAAQARFDEAAAALVDAFDLLYAETEPQPDPAERARQWRRRLEEMCEVVAIHPPDAVSALEREVHGIPPARDRSGGRAGSGARDAAIWLAIVRDHGARNEVGHLLTKDVKDFVAGERLKPFLLADLDGQPHPLHVHRGIPALLEDLGTSSAEFSIDPATLTERAFPALQQSFRDSPLIPQTVFEFDEGYRFRTELKTGEAIKVLRGRRFSGPAATVTMVDAEWRLCADCLYRDLAEDSERWFSFPDVELHGRLQVYLPEFHEDSADAQLIAAQLSSDTTIEIMGEDRLVISHRTVYPA